MKHDEHMIGDFGFYVAVAILCFIIGVLLYLTYKVLT